MPPPIRLGVGPTVLAANAHFLHFLRLLHRPNLLSSVALIIGHRSGFMAPTQGHGSAHVFIRTSHLPVS